MNFWQTPQALIRIGFERSRIVMMNEAHNHMLRCIRTRVIGAQILKSAHQQGVRYLAMEALSESDLIANQTRKLSDMSSGYLAQPEMQTFIQSALNLGWTLIAYGEHIRDYLASKGLNPDYRAYTSDAWEKIVVTNEFWRWREQSTAANLADAFLALPSDAKMLVWVGWQHHARNPMVTFDEPSQEYAMGYYFEQRIGETYFSIDQTMTILEENDNLVWRDFVLQYANTLHSLGDTAGFLRENAPHELQTQVNAQAHNAYILSLDNEMV